MPDRGLPALAGGSVLTVGTFDGVHLGHREILKDLRDRAAARGLPAAVLTFAPHPLAVVNPAAAPRLLTPGAERLAALCDSGAPEQVIVLPFTPALKSLIPSEFVRLLVDR